MGGQSRVLHGFNAVAELKGDKARLNHLAHAAVLHGFNAVAELKAVWQAQESAGRGVVLHGFNAVAELKGLVNVPVSDFTAGSPRLQRRGRIEGAGLMTSGTSARWFSTASTPWPN